MMRPRANRDGKYRQFNREICRYVLAQCAEAVEIPGFEKFEFFISRPLVPHILGEERWIVSEATTGSSVSDDRPTKAEAIESAKEKLSSHNPDTFRTLIEKALDDIAWKLIAGPDK